MGSSSVCCLSTTDRYECNDHQNTLTNLSILNFVSFASSNFVFNYWWSCAVIIYRKSFITQEIMDAVEISFPQSEEKAKLIIINRFLQSPHSKKLYKTGNYGCCRNNSFLQSEEKAKLILINRFSHNHRTYSIYINAQSICVTESFYLHHMFTCSLTYAAV